MTSTPIESRQTEGIVQVDNLFRNLSITNRYVMESTDISLLNLNIPLLKLYVSNYIGPRKDYYRENNTKLTIESSFSEWWLSKCLLGKRCGQGNCAMDVIIEDSKSAVDSCCVCMNESMTNEKSLIQNFTQGGDSLDVLFDNRDMTQITKKYTTAYRDKLLNFCTNRDVDCDRLYYYIFISTVDSIYLSSFKINIGNIQYVYPKNFTPQGKSIITQNFINDDIGKVILYKQKKRMEVRFLDSILNNDNIIKLYSLSD